VREINHGHHHLPQHNATFETLNKTALLELEINEANDVNEGVLFKLLAQYKMNNEKNSGDGAENNLAGRKKKQSVKMTSQGNVTGNIADHNDHAAPSDESTTSASSANSSKMMAQRRSSSVPQATKEFKALRGRVFDDMCSHFGYQHFFDPSVRSNTSLAHLGRGEMWFGDLDFSADADALLGQSNVTRSSSLPTMPSPQPVLS
jgi:hypothetical protein